MENSQPAFPLEKLSDQDLEFLIRLARSQTELLDFWKPFGATCAMAQAERILHGKDMVTFAFPENLNVHDAGVLQNEMVALLFKAEHGSEPLKTLITALGIVAGRAAKARALMN